MNIKEYNLSVEIAIGKRSSFKHSISQYCKLSAFNFIIKEKKCFYKSSFLIGIRNIDMEQKIDFEEYVKKIILPSPWLS